MSYEYMLALAKHLDHVEGVYSSQVLDLQRQQRVESGAVKQQLFNLKSHLFILSNVLVGWKAYCNSGQEMEKLIF